MRLVLAGLLALTACGGEGQLPAGTGGGGGTGGEGGTAPAGCRPGELEIAGEGCRPAGLPPDWTMPSIPEPAAGVPPDGCAPGFTHDGLGGCEAVLPAAPCLDGMMAVPGETACHAVAECGAAPWGSIPVDAATVYVDASFVGVSDGTAAAPFVTLQAAVDAASDGALLALAAGTYTESVAVQGKALRIWGRCPELVSLEGPSGESYVLGFDAAGASEVHDLAITGPNLGVLVTQDTSLTMDRVWVHDLGDRALAVDSPTGAMTLTRSLVERAAASSTYVRDGSLLIDACELRDSLWVANAGASALVAASTAQGAIDATITGSWLHHMGDVAIAVRGGSITVDGTVLEDTQSDESTVGWGLWAIEPAATPLSVDITRSLLRRNLGGQVVIEGGTTTVDATTFDAATVSDITSAALWITESQDAQKVGTLILTRSALRDQAVTAIDLDGADLTASEVLIQRSVPIPGGGFGIDAAPGFYDLFPSRVVVEDSRIEDCFTGGIAVFDADAEIRRTVLRGIRISGGGDPTAAIGIAYDGFAGPPQALVESVRIDDVDGIALLAAGAVVEGRDLHVSGVRVNPGPLTTGVGLGVVEQGMAGSLTLRNVLVEGYEGTGIIAGVNTTIDVEGALVRGSTPAMPELGRGIELDEATSTIRWSQIEDVVSLGLSFISNEGMAEGVWVRDVHPRADGSEGVGIAATDFAGGPANVLLRGCRVERAASGGVQNDGSVMTFESVHVADTQPNGLGQFGRGAQIQLGGTAAITGSLFERSFDVGIMVNQATAVIQQSTVTDVRPGFDDGLYGDGIAVLSGTAPVAVDGVLIENAERGGVLVFGGDVLLSNTELSCNGLSLNVEERLGQPGLITDLGGNVCGCDGETVACKALSSGLAPPEGLPPAGP